MYAGYEDDHERIGPADDLMKQTLSRLAVARRARTVARVARPTLTIAIAVAAVSLALHLYGLFLPIVNVLLCGAVLVSILAVIARAATRLGAESLDEEIQQGLRDIDS